MTRDDLEKRNVGENLDALMNLDPRGYGVCRILYAGSRAYTGEPLTMHAAQVLCDSVKENDLVYILVGFVLLPHKVPEMDGTVSAMLLARALVLAFGAKPVIVCPQDSVQAIEKCAAVVGLHIYEDLDTVQQDGSHTDLIAQIADGDIRHALRAQQVPERLALGLQRGHIQPHRVVVHAQRVGTAGFHRNYGGGLAGCQRGSLRRGGASHQGIVAGVKHRLAVLKVEDGTGQTVHQVTVVGHQQQRG